jgi:hypothetical protein
VDQFRGSGQARVLDKTRLAPPDGSTHWSLRKMAALMKVNKNLIARIWKEADLKPHRLDRYMASDDPRFEEKAADTIRLYLNPPQTRPSSASRKAQFRHLTDWIADSRSRPDRPKGSA